MVKLTNMKFILGFILGLIVLTVSVPILFFTFFINGKPRDLGVRYTPADYQVTHQKFGVDVGKLESAPSSPKDSIQYSGSKEAKLNLNSTEVTSYLNASKWTYAPASNVQVKINSDGSGEISGLVNVRNLLTYVSLVTPNDDVQKALDEYHIPANPPFYAKGTVSVINNKVNFSIQSLEIAKIPVPQQYVSENIGALNSFASDKLNSIPNLKVRSLNLDGGKVNMDATVPAKVLKQEK